MQQTTVRVNVATRDRLLALAAAEFGGASADQVLNMLMDAHWKAAAITSWDELRLNDRPAWQEMLESAPSEATA